MYEDGQIAGGHRFDAAANVWVPLVPNKPKMGLGKKIAIGAGGTVAGLFLIGACAAIVSGGATPTNENPAVAAAPVAPVVPAPVVPAPVVPAPVEPAPVEPAPVEPAPVPEPAEPQLTASQENAIEQAESYLETSSFSKQGLIDQLSSEYGSDFPKKDAVFAVEYLKVDWNAEAVEQAKSYLETSSFSKKGLIEQLSSPYGSQFTKAQAVYAANKVYR